MWSPNIRRVVFLRPLGSGLPSTNVRKGCNDGWGTPPALTHLPFTLRCCLLGNKRNTSYMHLKALCKCSSKHYYRQRLGQKEDCLAQGHKEWVELQLPRCSTALSGSDLGLYHCGGFIAFYVPLSGPKGFFFSSLKVSGGTLGIKIRNFEFAPILPRVSCLGGAQ